jgi:hypothetical protein
LPEVGHLLARASKQAGHYIAATILRSQELAHRRTPGRVLANQALQETKTSQLADDQTLISFFMFFTTHQEIKLELNNKSAIVLLSSIA